VQNGGFVSLNSSVLLFINCLGPNDGKSIETKKPLSFARYPNEFFENGKYFTWFIDGNRFQQFSDKLKQTEIQNLLSGLYQNHSNNKLIELLDGYSMDLMSNKIILFIRQRKGPYLFCGRCRSVKTSPISRGQIKITFELLDFQNNDSYAMDWDDIKNICDIHMQELKNSNNI
jgi:hypothetical protein